MTDWDKRVEEREETRGMSLRELVIELRRDVKDIRSQLATVPSRKEVYSVIATILTIVVAVIAL